MRQAIRQADIESIGGISVTKTLAPGDAIVAGAVTLKWCMELRRFTLTLGDRLRAIVTPYVDGAFAQITVSPGELIQVYGDEGGELIIGVGTDLAFTVKTDPNRDDVHVAAHCPADVQVRYIPAATYQNPLCKFGPGGDYVDSYTPGQSQEPSHAVGPAAQPA